MSYPPSQPPYGSPVPYGSHGTTHTQVAIPHPQQSSTAHVVIAWIVAVLTAGYMLPWAIAATRNKSNTSSIALVNVLLGWTLVGWVVALVMSASSEPRPVVYLNAAVLPPYQPASPPQYSPYSYAPAPQHDADRPTEPTAILPPHDDEVWSRPNDLR